MAISNKTINVSIIDIPGTTINFQLEQITTLEAQRRRLSTVASPILFERPGDFPSTDQETPFRIEVSDFKGSRQGNYDLVVPQDAVAYVVGEDNRAVRSRHNDYTRPAFLYVPVQFYK